MAFPIKDREDASLDQIAILIAEADLRLRGEFAAELRHVVVRTSRGRWENFASQLRLVELGSPTERIPCRVEMPAVVLLSKTVDLKEIVDGRMLRGVFTSWRGHVPADEGGEWQETSRATRWPSRSLIVEPSWSLDFQELGFDGGYSAPDGPFISADYELFAEYIGPLAAAWLSDPRLATEHQVRNHYRLLLPDLRARLIDIQLSGARVEAQIERRDPNLSLFCGASAESYGGERITLLVPVVQDSVTLEFPRAPKTLRMWIVSRDGEWLDRYDEGPFGASWGETLLMGGSPSAIERHLQDALIEGEGQRLEFKQWIPTQPQTNKSPEFLKTLVAFSNSEGGDLYIGVDDNAEIASIVPLLQKEYGRQARGDLAALQDPYVRALSKMVADRIAGKVRPDFTWIDYGGLPVLRVHVSRGDHPPYVLTDTGAIFVRRGATNRKAAPSDLRLLFSSGIPPAWAF